MARSPQTTPIGFGLSDSLHGGMQRAQLWALPLGQLLVQLCSHAGLSSPTDTSGGERERAAARASAALTQHLSGALQ